MRARLHLAATELRPSSFPAFRDAILAAQGAPPHAVRTYPGYPTVALPRVRRRSFVPFDRVLLERRSAWRLREAQPDPRALARTLLLGHGVTGPEGRGPAPSAGNLQPIELYLFTLVPGWLPPGAYHYDRARHLLSRLAEGDERASLVPWVPSFRQVEGGGLLVVLSGDAAKVEAKYRERAARFLLLEAGHVMQSLCLAASSAGLCVVPIGGAFEAPLAERLALPDTDALLHAGVLGASW